MTRVLLVCASALALLASPVAAQNLTPDDVANAYVEGVTLCAHAKTAGLTISQLSDVDRARVTDAGEQMRGMADVPEGRPAWDVLSARGIVVISEPTDFECNVTAYGPRVRPVFDRTAQALSGRDLGFAEVAVEPDPSSILRSFERVDGERRVSVLLEGGEPGMPGRVARFPVLTAFVRSN